MHDRDAAAALQYESPSTVSGQNFCVDSCSDMTVCELDAADIEARGQIVELTVRLRSVCPGKRCALGVLLHETDTDGNEQPRGMKTLAVPARSEAHACDILVRHIRFVLPQELSLSTEGDSRRFIAHTTAHYIDVDSSCLCPARRRGCN